MPEWNEHVPVSSPPPPGLYVALGDSITFGYGTSQNCQAFPMHPVDIASMCPDGTSYAVRVAKALRAEGVAGRFMNLGINGADVSRILRDELPLLPQDATLITIYVGTNDSRGVAAPQATVDAVVSKFERLYTRLLAEVHQRAPQAKIILVNFPNERALGELLVSNYHTTPEALQKYEPVSQQLDAFIDHFFPQYAVVDTACMPQSYDTSLLYRLSVHPNDEGADL